MSTSPLDSYPIHTISSAPEAAKEALRTLERDFGFIPNVAGAMAESPTALNAFLGVFHTFHHGTFTGAQRQVLLLTNAVTNGCAWAVALHSALAVKEGVARDDVDAIRAGSAPADPKLGALSRYTRTLIEKRGAVGESDIAAFVDSGFTRDQTLEVIVGIAGSAFTNYAANVAHPPLEPQFGDHRWTPGRLRGERASLADQAQGHRGIEQVSVVISNQDVSESELAQGGERHT